MNLEKDPKQIRARGNKEEEIDEAMTVSIVMIMSTKGRGNRRTRELMVARIKQTTQVQAIAKNETLAGFNYSPVT